MNEKFINYGWNISKRNNLYKIIDGECYTIIENDYDYAVLCTEYRIKGLLSLYEAKAKVFELAYEDYNESWNTSCDEYSNNPLYGEIVKAGYRQLSKKYHPDAGGDAEKMKSLNNLYELLKQEAG